MEQSSLLILSLFLTCGALFVILFMAWRAFGEQRHVLTWSIVFIVLAADLAVSYAAKSGWLTNIYMQWGLITFLSILAPVLAEVGYRQRLEKHVYLALQAGLVIAVCGASAWFAFEQPHVGINAAIIPFATALIFMWISWIVYDVPRPKRSIEWASIAGYAVFGIAAAAGGIYGLSFGAEIDPAKVEQYELVLFATLPSAVVVMGLLMLSIVAADLAKQAEDLTDYQELKLKEDTEKTWGTLQDAIEAIPDVIAIDDGKGTIVTCNEAFANLLQRPKEKIIGMRSVEMFELYTKSLTKIDGEDVKNGQHIIHKFAHALTTGARIEITSRTNRNYIVDVAYLRSGGQIIIVRDVTQLSNARARLEAAINSLPIGFAFFDRNNKLVACNHNYEKLHQKDTAWVEKQTIENLISNIVRRFAEFKNTPLLERSAWVYEALKAIENRKVHNSVAKFDDGKWYEMTIQPVEGGGFVSLANDITNRRLLELETEQNEEKLREILGNQPFPVIVISKADQRILFSSRAATEVLANYDDDLVGYEASRFMSKEALTDSISVQESLKELTLRKKSGDMFPALLSGQNITYSGNDARVISFIDITNIHELTSELAVQRQALMQSEKLNALGTLLAGVAHELNNPLTVVVANAHVLAMSSENETMQARIEKITNAAERCSRIVRSFLDMARKSPGEKVAFDILKCVDQAIDITSFGLQEHNVEIINDLPVELPFIVGDADQFSQAVINLIINAQHALMPQPEPRRIRLFSTYDSADKKIELHIHDNGPGISDEIRDRIFEPFFSTKEVGQGTGMGLSLVRNIIQAQGGDIRLLPNVNDGAHFVITLVVNGDDKTFDQERRVSDRPVKAYRILIVDDDPDVREVLGDMLVLQGHDVIDAASGKIALDMLAKYDFDCVLTDLRMPDMDGPQLFAAIKKDYPDMEKCTGFVTGNNLSEPVRKFLDQCGQPSLGKPFLPEELQAFLDGLIKVSS